MRILLTGATRMIGRAIAAHAARDGIQVRGLSRDPLPQAGTFVDWRQADLNHPLGLRDAVKKCDAVVHAAGASSGPLAALMMRNLLDAMRDEGVAKLVLISSMAVLDYRTIRADAQVNEQSPLESAPAERDDYARAKLQQEQLAEIFKERGGDITIVRPGAVVFPGNVWTPRLGFKLGISRWLRVATGAMLPLVHLDACAEAIVAIALNQSSPSIVHLINADPPTQNAYIEAMIAQERLNPPVMTIRYATLRRIARSTRPITRKTPIIARRIPGPVPTRLDARFKPLSYSTSLGNSFMRDMSARSAVDLLAAGS